MKRLFVSSIIFFLCNSVAFSQKYKPSDHNFIETSYRAGSLFKSYASFWGLSLGREFLNKYSFSLVYQVLITDFSASKLENINFWYLGPQFTGTLYSNNTLTLYGGAIISVGNYSHSELNGNSVISGVGIEPELGLRYKVTNHLKLKLKTSLFGGIGGDFIMNEIPSICLGVRFIP